jgi:hypothetical protein
MYLKNVATSRLPSSLCPTKTVSCHDTPRLCANNSQQGPFCVCTVEACHFTTTFPEAWKDYHGRSSCRLGCLLSHGFGLDKLENDQTHIKPIQNALCRKRSGRGSWSGIATRCDPSRECGPAVGFETKVAQYSTVVLYAFTTNITSLSRLALNPPPF